MPEETRKRRMTVCFALTQSRAQSNRDALEATIKEMRKQHNMMPNEAANAIVVSWMMACYMNIDEEGMAGSLPTQQDDTDIFSDNRDRPQRASQASARQWKLLEEVLMVFREQQGQKYDQMERPLGESPSGFSGPTQTLYFFAVFGVIFGALTLGVARLMWSGKAGREKSGKSLKKAEKAERKLAKKRL